MNKLTVGLESCVFEWSLFFLRLVFKKSLSWIYSWFLFSLSCVDQAETSVSNSATRKLMWPLIAVMSLLSMLCHRSASQVPQQFLDYIRELMTSFLFPQSPMTLTHHTYSIMLRSVHITSYKIFNDFLSLLLFKPDASILSTSERKLKRVSCCKTRIKFSSPCTLDWTLTRVASSQLSFWILTWIRLFNLQVRCLLKHLWLLSCWGEIIIFSYHSWKSLLIGH